MEIKLNSLTELMDKLIKRINSAKENNNISTIEIDIMLDLLRQAYVTTEQLRTETITGKEQMSRVTSLGIPVIPVSVNQEQEVSKQPEILKTDLESSIDQPVVQPDYSHEAQMPVEQVPQMSFPKVEVVTNEISFTTAPSNPIPEPVDLFVVASKPTESPVSVATHDQPPIYEAKIEERKQEDTPVIKNQRMPGDLFGMPTIADKLKSEAPSVVDRINQGKPDQTLADKMQLKRIDDLKNAIGINEKFQFVNDLFEGRIELYNDAINRFNTCGSVNIAESIFEGLKSTHGWNEHTEAFHKLKTFINRRYL